MKLKKAIKMYLSIRFRYLRSFGLGCYCSSQLDLLGHASVTVLNQNNVIEGFGDVEKDGEDPLVDNLRARCEQ